MPNVIAQTTLNPASASSSKRLPRSVERALADAQSLSSADVPWTPPLGLPEARDLWVAIEKLTAVPVEPKHAAFCFAKLMMAFEPTTRLTADETRLRVAVWMEANSDLTDDQWNTATLAALRGSKWMPKPAEFRMLIASDLALQAQRLMRCQAMLAVHEATGKAVEAAKTTLGRESRATMLPLLIKSARARFDHAAAVKFAKELAAIHKQPLPD